MSEFFQHFNWDSFWMNSFVSLIFLVLSVIISIYAIPYFTLKLLKKRRKKYEVSKVAYIIQELCEFVEQIPYKDKEQVLIYIKGKRVSKFIGLINFNLFNDVTLKIIPVLLDNKYAKLKGEDKYRLLTQDKDRIDKLRIKLEEILGFHSFGLDEEILSEVSLLCVEIKAYDIHYRFNDTIGNLVKQGIVDERKAVSGVPEIVGIYSSIFELFIKLLKLKEIEVNVGKRQ